MSAKSNTAGAGDAGNVASAPARSKKLLVIILGVVLALVLAAVGAFFYVGKQRSAADDAWEGAEGVPAKASVRAVAGSPPAYLPLDSMVVNLADPGGEKVAQIGVTLVVADAHASDKVKAFLPTIRSGILMLISQRTSEELLQQEGKEKLAKDILRETTLPFGGGGSDSTGEDGSSNKEKSRKNANRGDFPVVGVLFSSFIVQ